MQHITGEGTMNNVGGLKSRPFYIGTRQTAVFCEEMEKSTGKVFDLQDYNDLLGEIFGNSFLAAQAKEAGTVFTPVGRKELTPREMRNFVYSALYAGAKREGLPVDFDPDTVSDWIDGAETSEVLKPIVTHLALLTQKAERQQAGNAPAPAMKVSRGSKKTLKS